MSEVSLQGLGFGVWGLRLSQMLQLMQRQKHHITALRSDI